LNARNVHSLLKGKRDDLRMPVGSPLRLVGAGAFSPAFATAIAAVPAVPAVIAAAALGVALSGVPLLGQGG